MITAHPVAGKRKAVDICNAFIQGTPKDAAGHVFYGVNRTNLDAWHKVIGNYGCTFYYVDNSYFDNGRGEYYRITRNRLQHSGQGIATDTGKARFAKLNVQIDEWKPPAPEKSIVIIEQSDDFMSIMNDSGDNVRFTPRIVNALASITSRPVQIRRWTSDKPALAGSLDEELDSVHALVTWSSAAAITALLRGVSVTCFGQCAVEPFSTPIKEIDTPAPISVDDRYNWACVLAANQFTIEEMRDGTAWRLLNAQ